MRGIDINDFYTGINFNQKLNINMLIKYLRVREMKLILIFPIETTNSLSVFLLISAKHN